MLVPWVRRVAARRLAGHLPGRGYSREAGGKVRGQRELWDRHLTAPLARVGIGRGEGRGKVVCECPARLLRLPLGLGEPGLGAVRLRAQPPGLQAKEPRLVGSEGKKINLLCLQITDCKSSGGEGIGWAVPPL